MRGSLALMRDVLGFADDRIMGLLGRCGYGLVLEDDWHKHGSITISPEAFESELVTLGLSGAKFSPDDYAAALEHSLGVDIEVYYLNTAQHPGFLQRLAIERRFAQTYFYNGRRANICVPSSLPPMLSPLVIYHELAHIAMGDHPFELSATNAVADYNFPLPASEIEEEANIRACFALVFGLLGEDNPYSGAMEGLMRYEII